MIRPQRYFPWKLARDLFFSSLSVIGVTLIMIGFSVRFQIFKTFSRSEDSALALGAFDSYLWSLLAVMFAISTLMFGWLVYRYAQPLGRLIQKARELRRLDTLPEEDLTAAEEPGEWHDLERVLYRFHRDLRGKTEALSRESQELSALIGAVSDAILAVDREERPLFYNSPFTSMFRVSSQSQKLLSLGEIFRVPDVLVGFREVLATGGRRLVTASLHTHAHALPRHFSISIAPLKFAGSQNVDGAIGVFHDITELKASEQIRIEFVANASHELRTPLTTIKGYVDTLKADLKADRVQAAAQFADIISRNVDRLTLLVSDLLDLSTLESGAELIKSRIDVSELTEAALRQLEGKRQGKNQSIRTEIRTEKVAADPQRVEQVLVNLVHNAIKYTPEGSRIEVVWEKTTEGTLLRVRDNGPGIALEHQPRLFERFYRVDAGRSRDQGGTGLGLAIVKHIMLKHGGSARVQSRIGEGTEFTCIFP